MLSHCLSINVHHDYHCKYIVDIATISNEPFIELLHRFCISFAFLFARLNSLILPFLVETITVIKDFQEFSKLERPL